MAKKTFEQWMRSQGHSGKLNEYDADAITASATEYRKYLEAEDAKADPGIAYQRQADRLHEAFNAMASLKARVDGRRIRPGTAITWADVAELRPTVNALCRVLGLNEETDSLPADTPPAP